MLFQTRLAQKRVHLSCRRGPCCGHVSGAIVVSTCARVMWRYGTCGKGKLIRSIGRMTWKAIVSSSESHQKRLDATGCLELGSGIDEYLRRRRGRQSSHEDIYSARPPSLPVSPSINSTQ